MTMILRLRWAALLAAIVLTVWFGLFQRFLPPISYPMEWRGTSDHNLHVAAFLCVAFLASLGQRRWWLWTLAVMVAACALEALQLQFPQRGANLNDLYASLAGAGAGGVLAAFTNLAIRSVEATRPRGVAKWPMSRARQNGRG